MISRVFLKRKVNNFNFFFCFLTNTILVNRGYIWQRISLPTNTFCVLSNKKIGEVFLLKFFKEGLAF